MNKTAIKNFAIWARNKLIADIQYRAGLMGITAEGIKNALPQSTPNMEFYDIGTAEPYSITGEAIQQRKKLVEILRRRKRTATIPPPISTFWKRWPTLGSTGLSPSALWRSTTICLPIFAFCLL